MPLLRLGLWLLPGLPLGWHLLGRKMPVLCRVRMRAWGLQRMRAMAAMLWGVLALACTVAQAESPAPALQLSNHLSHTLAGHLSMRIDPQGTLTIDEVRQLPAQAFSPLPGQVSEGFTEAAVWLRFTLLRTAADPALWWLEFDGSVLDEIRVYQPQPDGTLRERLGGANHAEWRQHELNYRHLVLKLELPADTPQTFHVRLSSRTAMALGLVAWQPGAFTQAALAEAQLSGVFFGVYLFILLFYLTFWYGTREPLHSAYTQYIALNVLVTSLSGGWLQQLVPALQSPWGNTLLGLTVCITMVAALRFCALMLQPEGKAQTLLRSMVWVGYATAAVACALVLAGLHPLGMRVVQPVTTVLLLAIFSLACRLAWLGSSSARFFLLAFSFYYIGVLVRFMRNLGWLEPSFWTDYSYQIGTFIHLVLMSLIIYREYHQLKEQKETAEALAATQSRLREQERDFMGLVSHEFRTPLSIIAASAHNLMQSPRLEAPERERGDKILRAVKRITSLMDTYLSIDRMHSAEQTLNLQECDLAALCQDVVHDVQEPSALPIRAQIAVAGSCRCDPSLVAIALRNLLHNAQRHSPATQAVQLTVEEDPYCFNLKVHNAGDAIPSDELPQLFKRFFRGRRALSQPGAGLGLYLVDTVARRHGGSISVSSQPEQGTTFTLQLPKRMPPRVLPASPG